MPSQESRGNMVASGPAPILKPLASRLKAKRSGTSMMAASERVNQVRFTFIHVIAAPIHSLNGMIAPSG